MPAPVLAPSPVKFLGDLGSKTGCPSPQLPTFMPGDDERLRPSKNLLGNSDILKKPCNLPTTLADERTGWPVGKAALVLKQKLAANGEVSVNGSRRFASFFGGEVQVFSK